MTGNVSECSLIARRISSSDISLFTIIYRGIVNGGREDEDDERV